MFATVCNRSETGGYKGGEIINFLQGVSSSFHKAMLACEIENEHHMLEEFVSVCHKILPYPFAKALAERSVSVLERSLGRRFCLLLEDLHDNTIDLQTAADSSAVKQV